MTPGDIARVLAKAAAFDLRTIGEFDVMAWHEALSDIDGADALAAVTFHYRQTEDRLMPTHVRRIVGEIQRERRRALREHRESLAIAAEAEVDRGPLTDRSSEIQQFVAGVREVLPEGDVEALHPRAVHWEREHRAYLHQQEADPNPNYDPTMRPVPEWNGSTQPPPGAWWEDDTSRERHAATLLAEAGRLRPRAES